MKNDNDSVSKSSVDIKPKNIKKSISSNFQPDIKKNKIKKLS